MRPMSILLTNLVVSRYPPAVSNMKCRFVAWRGLCEVQKNVPMTSRSCLQHWSSLAREGPSGMWIQNDYIDCCKSHSSESDVVLGES